VEIFVKAQEKNLKKLTGSECDFSFLNDLKDLRLEYLDFVGPTGHNESTPSLRFLGHQVDLKYLKLSVSDENFNLICGLKKLEVLDLRSWFENPNLTNLHKLQTLRRLKVFLGFSKNILDHLKFGVFNDLDELEACLEGASVESVRKMKRIAPNLKKIGFILLPRRQ
jgi:hypothetical protein